MRLATRQTRTLRVFLSSGGDAIVERDFLDALIRDGLVPPLMHSGSPIRIEVDRWERTAPHKIVRGGSPNDEFVARAKVANLVVGILKEELRPGTKEELEAVLEDDEAEVEVAIVWCADPRDDPPTEVAEWLKDRQGIALYDKAGLDDTDGPRIAFVRLMTEALLAVLRNEDGGVLLRERRD
jgi:hypothetical protein